MCESCYLNGGVGVDVTMVFYIIIWEIILVVGILVGRIVYVFVKKIVI